MKNIFYLILICTICLLTVGCGNANNNNNISNNNVIESITTSEVKEILDNKNEKYILIDVREEYEFNEGHIPGAVNIPVGNINSIEYDKDKIIIVYCRSGTRSRDAANKLSNIGYTVKDMGGIISWNYEIE